MYNKLVSREGEEEEKPLTAGARIQITHLSANRNMPSIMDPVRWRKWLHFELDVEYVEFKIVREFHRTRHRPRLRAGCR